MGVKIMVDIQGNKYDFWEVRSLGKFEEYNEDKESMEYGIIMNRNAIGLNYQDVKFLYDTKEQRDEAMLKIEQSLLDYDVVLIVK